MRPIARLAIAVTIVAASAGAALALALEIVNSYAAFRDSPTMDVRHAWTIRGGDKGETRFAIRDGECFFGQRDARFDCSVLRTKPTPTLVEVPFGIAKLARISNSAYSYRAGENSARPRRGSPTPVQTLALQNAIVSPIVGFEEPAATPTYHPIGGTVSLTRGATTLNGRTRRGLTSYDVDIVSSYRGTIVGGPNDGRTVRGRIVVRARGLPRKTQ